MSRVLHAGLHKTGSTFLQAEFFPKLRNTVFIRKLDLGRVPIFDTERMSVIFSNEAACGYPYPKTQRFSTERLESNINLLRVEKVIIVRREFYSWVLSVYYQTLNEKHTWSLEEFISKNQSNLLTWKDAAHRIQEMCNRKNVDCMIIQFEKLKSDQMGTLKEMSQFIEGSNFDVERLNLGKERNLSRYGVTTIFAYRFLNILFNNKLGRLCERIVRKIPRRIINGRVGLGLERVSPRKLSVDDVRRMMQ